jgi:signal transduction histidine kinase
MRSSANRSTLMPLRAWFAISPRRSVVARVVALTALGAAAIAVTLTLFYLATARLKDANVANSRATRASVAALSLEDRVTDLAATLRTVTRDPTPLALARWHRAARAWQGPARDLVSASAPARGQRNVATLLQAQIRSYISDYGELLIKIARLSRGTARSSDATAESATRVRAIIASTNALAHSTAADAIARSTAARHLSDEATAGGIAALVLTPILLVLLGIWLARTIARPLQQAVAASTAVAAGDFTVRLDASRRDEFGRLASAFNEMTTSLAAARTELSDRAEQLAQAEQRQSELTSIVSHEVRTPLSSILGFTRLLLQRELPADQRREYLEIVDAQSTRLAELVTDFLDVRLMQSGNFNLTYDTLDLRALIEEQAQLAGAGAAGRHIAVTNDDEPLLVDGDRLRLAQVLANLLSNAVKYSAPNSTVAVSSGGDRETATVCIDDEGIGIPPEHRTRIFEPFYRGGAPAAGIAGTGLGLALSQQIVQAHGGALTFEARERGTRFRIRLPRLERGPGTPA